MAGALLDLERLIAAHREPREPGCAQVVEADRLPRGVVGEQLGTVDAGPAKVVAQRARQVRRLRNAHQVALALPLGVHRFEERQHSGLHGEPSSHAPLGGLEDLFALARTHVARRLVDLDDAPLDVDRAPFERLKLARAGE